MNCLTRFTRLLIACATLTVLTNCSINESLDATKAVPGKMDKMTDEVKHTNKNTDTMVDEVKKTNAGVEKTNQTVKNTNDGMNTMVDQVKKTNAGIEKTNRAVHNQTMAVSLAEMLKEENTRYLLPPTGMIPAGVVLAQEASADELVKLVFNFMTEIETAFPPISEQLSNGEWSPETINKMNHDKTVKFTAASILSGLAPQETIDEMIKEQITEGGRFEKAAYQVLALRFSFINQMLLEAQVLASPLTNPGSFDEAIDLTEKISLIADLPYADKISITTSGILPPAENYSFNVERGQVIAKWKKIDKAFDRDLDPKYREAGNASAEKLSKLRRKVKSHLEASTENVR